jgi:hypothetical protein
MTKCMFWSGVSGWRHRRIVLGGPRVIGQNGIIGQNVCLVAGQSGVPWYSVGKLDADVGAYRVDYVHHVSDVPVALYPADDQFDLVVSRLDPRVVHVPADRVRDVLLVAFDFDVRFLERRNPFNRYSRYGFGSSAFQPRAPAILPACSRAARKRSLRASSSASITHSMTWNGQTQRSHPCVDPSTQSVI